MLFWMYHSTATTIKHEQQLSIELNNRNSARVLDTSRQMLANALYQAVHAFSDHHIPNTSDIPERLNKAVTSLESNFHLDLMRFISTDQQQMLSADSPFFNFDGADELFSANNEQFLNSAQLLPVGDRKNRLWLMVTGERVVDKESGRVWGILIGGIVLNDNMPIVRDMLQRSDAEYAAIMVGDQLISSNRTLPVPLLHKAKKALSPVSKVSCSIDGTDQEMTISRYQYPLKSAKPLNVFLFYRGSLHKEIQQTMIRSGAIILLSTIFLFILFFQLSKTYIARAINHLVLYTEQAADTKRKTAYQPETLLEFNQVGLAVEKMVGLLDDAGEELRESKERLEFIINSAELGTWDWDVLTGNAIINDRFSGILGYAPGELTPNLTSWEKKLHPDDKKDVMQAMVNHLKGKTPLLNKELRLRHKSGRWIWALDVGKVFKRDAAGKAVRVVGIHMDITKRKTAEQKLADERELLAVTLRSIGDAVFTTDTDGRIVFLNKVAEELTGWSNKDAQSRLSAEIFNIINEKTGQPYENPVLKVLKTGEGSNLSKPVILVAQDGGRKTIADSAAPIRDRKRKVIGVVVVFRDVTHEQILEQELLKSKKLESVGILAGGIAHDFNNILFAMIGNIELASFLVENKDEEAETLLANALKAAARAEKLTKQLLTFSRGGEPVKDITSLPELIRDSADFVLHGSKVVCSYQFADDLWLVDADGGQVGQVIQNLVINAKHAMPGGGTVEIIAANVADPSSTPLLHEDNGDYVSIAIHDKGEGIPEDNIDKIFDPYFTTSKKGHGLGLSICHSIITKHNGHLVVESDPGQGTTFTIYLPALQGDNVQTTVQEYTTSPVNNARIMMMDDDSMVLELVNGLLTALGHEAVLVADGDQAISRYVELRDAGTPVDLVIMDLTIAGGMGGEEAARELLELDAEAKIIVASGYSNNPVMANYQEYGFLAAIAKPFMLAGLDRVIEKVLCSSGETVQG